MERLNGRSVREFGDFVLKLWIASMKISEYNNIDTGNRSYKEDVHMIEGMDAAKFLLYLDDSRKIFNKELRTQNGRTFY